MYHDILCDVRSVARQRDGKALLLAAIAALFTLDVATTAYALNLGLSEGNPFMATVLERAGIVGLMGAKLLALIWLTYAPRLTARPKLTFKAASAVVIAMYLAVLASNAYRIANAG